MTSNGFSWIHLKKWLAILWGDICKILANFSTAWYFWKQHEREAAVKNVFARVVICFKSVKVELIIYQNYYFFPMPMVLMLFQHQPSVTHPRVPFEQNLCRKNDCFLQFFSMTFKSWINSCAVARIVYMHMLTLETKVFYLFFFCSCYQMLQSVYMNKTSQCLIP